MKELVIREPKSLSLSTKFVQCFKETIEPEPADSWCDVNVVVLKW